MQGETNQQMTENCLGLNNIENDFAANWKDLNLKSLQKTKC